MPHKMGITTRYVDRAEDPTQARLDPVKVESQKLVRAPIGRATTTIITLADRYYDSPSRTERVALAKCLTRHFDAIATGRALEGAQSPADQFYRNWIVSALSIAYLKAEPSLEYESSAEPFRSWLHDTAQSLRVFHEERIRRGEINNHLFWGGLAIAASGRICNDDSQVAFGTAILKRALASVGPEGLFTAESRRGVKARHYHIFAAIPLGAIKLLSRPALTSAEQHSYRRLARAIVRSFQEPNGGQIAQATGLAQQEEQDLSGLLVIAAGDTASASSGPLNQLARHSRHYSFFLGGKLSYLTNLSK